MKDRDRILSRDITATQIPSGDKHPLPAGTKIFLHQTLGGSFTVQTDHGLYRIDGSDGDALGETVTDDRIHTETLEDGSPNPEAIWTQLKKVYDPEIPVNIVDLGLVYSMDIEKIAAPAPTPGATAPTRNEELETRNPGAESAEHHLLLLCLHNEPLAPAIAHLILDTGWIDDTHVAGALLKKTLNHFASDDWPGRDHLDEHGILETDAEKTLAATLLFDPPKTDDPRRAIDQTLTALRNRALTTALRQIELALANLPPDSVAEQTTLIKQRIELQRQLRQPFGLPAAA